MHRGMQLFQLVIHLRGDSAVANVRVNLAAQGHAYAHRLKRPGQVMHIGRNDQPAPGHLRTDQFRLHIFPTRHKFHGGGDFTFAGGFKLGRHRADPPG